MELKEAKEVIQAGLSGTDWTDEQKEAMKVALVYMNQVEELKKEVIELEETRDFLNSVIGTMKK